MHIINLEITCNHCYHMNQSDTVVVCRRSCGTKANQLAIEIALLTMQKTKNADHKVCHMGVTMNTE